MTKATLTISSKNYSSWSMRGWLLVKFAGLPFEELVISPDDPAMRAEILLLAPSMLVPCLTHNGVKVWDTLAIAEYLNELKPKAGMMPPDKAARAHCRAICGEMHSGFSALRSALPMNLKGKFDNFKIWARAQADIDRVLFIWHDCLESYGGPYLFGDKPCMADLMYAPVVTRFLTYGVRLDAPCAAYCERIMALPHVKQWVDAAKLEHDDIDELDAEF
ncbi:glutathione S-transferase family protein [Undibacterium sp.]|jgi:glutathione S-transferase|uniref:glutathione S-transferase family protein n=1 Tax=Undibacterium sp. TaxID=1914977 RepID=UPI002D08CC65|nr:glutathione S-transferase family protein [Undibacterium sp.]HTD03010.1 glutathione S-transferase family protein [Undibacterium sp.]